MEPKAIKLGISACLLGEKVRYDGQGKLDRYLRDCLGAFVTYVPVCPEVGCGLGVPRPAMRLVGDPANPRLLTVKDGADLTGRMRDWAAAELDRLGRERLCGFVFKKSSPSSAMLDAKVYTPEGMPSHRGPGLFARAFMERFPTLPVEDEGRLNDPALRDNFLERVFAMARWLEMSGQGRSVAALSDFHARHKLALMAHSTVGLKRLGALVAGGKALGTDMLFPQYLEGLMATLKLKATAKKHCNALQHAMGYFKNQLDKDEKAELLELIGQYHDGVVPLLAPLTLLRHYTRKYDQPYLRGQLYLAPSPAELKLRDYA